VREQNVKTLPQISLGFSSKLDFGLSLSLTAFGDPLEKPAVFIETPLTPRTLETGEFSVFLLDAFQRFV
jgi:hypothetical protein